MEHVTIVCKVLFSIMVHDRGRVMTQSVDNSSGNGVREQEREREGAGITTWRQVRMVVKK